MDGEDEPTETTHPGASDDAERERLYNIAALAQSIAPRGLADLLNATPERRARARQEWQARPRLDKVAFYGFLGVSLLLGAIVVAGIAMQSLAVVLIGAGAFVLAFVLLTAVSIVSELRRSATRRKDRCDPS